MIIHLAPVPHSIGYPLISFFYFVLYAKFAETRLLQVTTAIQ